jgi:hypothetical protein
MSGGVLEGASPSIEWGGFGACLPLIEWGRLLPNITAHINLSFPFVVVELLWQSYCAHFGGTRSYVLLPLLCMLQ